MNKKYYKNKVAIITGGASGIGKMLGLELAKLGTTVVLVDINMTLLKKVVDKIKKNEGKAEAFKLDVTDLEQFKKIATSTKTKHGKIDFIFNNAGIAIAKPTQKLEDAEWNKIIDINIKGVVNGVQSVYPIMVEQGHGHVVNTASMAGVAPAPFMTAYAMTKHAVVGLSTSMADEAARLGIFVSAICPSFVKTPMVMRGIENEKQNKMAKSVMEVGVISPEQCVREALSGISDKVPIIVIPAKARAIWKIYRASPNNISKFYKQLNSFNNIAKKLKKLTNF